MLDEICEITYQTAAGEQTIKLDCSDERFDETLRVIEQGLADCHAQNIVYTHRPRRDDDFITRKS